MCDEWNDDVDVENYHCGNCKYFNVKADLDGVESICKRIDHKKVKFAVPWFKSYDCHQSSGIVCSDFKPASWCKYACKIWRGFEHYWKGYVDQWLPYKDIETTVGFTLNGNTEVRYKVKLMDFVNGTMFDGNKLKAIEKEYYNIDRKDVLGYRLVREKIDGVNIT